jgi:hypothetical protein
MVNRGILLALAAATFVAIAGAAMVLMTLSLGVGGHRTFLASFEVRNESGVPVRITPIGMRRNTGQYGPLPRFIKGAPHDRMEDRFDIPLAAAETIRITYYVDDINFRHLLVRVPGGKLRIVDTDKKGTLHMTFGPQSDVYGIPMLVGMEPAPAELEPCARGETVKYSNAVDYTGR